jgi:hypothetical protein
MSAIDPTVPTFGDATTESVRNNFAAAKEELEFFEANGVLRPELGAYLPINGSRAMTGALPLSGPPTAALHATTRAYVDATAATARDDALETAAGLYLPLTGGNVSGPITLLSPGTQPAHAATRQFVEGRVARDGDVMTGPLTLAADPVVDLHAATRGWTNREVATRVQRSGDAMTGPLTLAGDPSSDLQAANAGWVNRQIGSVAGITEAPDDNRIHGRSPGRWDPVLPLWGGQMTGPLSLADDPTIANGAATARFVLRAAVPIGSMVDFASNKVPDRWLPCAGQEVSREHYAELFDVIGTIWGEGDGETTFNLPDYRGRTSIGWDNPIDLGAAGRVTVFNSTLLGNAGGNEWLQAHNHALHDPGHGHGAGDNGHLHGLPDPGHNHGLHDPSHAHGMHDPGHMHDVNCSHGDNFPFGAGGQNAALAPRAGNSVGTHVSGTFVGVHGAHTGMWMDAAGTGAWIDWGHAAVVVHAALTNMWIDQTGGGNQQNIPPALIAAKIIYAGVLEPADPPTPDPLV